MGEIFKPKFAFGLMPMQAADFILGEINLYNDANPLQRLEEKSERKEYGFKISAKLLLL